MISSHEIKRLNWSEIRARVTGPRMSVHATLLGMGRSATTREVAEALRWSVLTVRPRVTELIQLGYVECVGRRDGEGLYRARDEREAHAAHAASLADRITQPNLL